MSRPPALDVSAPANLANTVDLRVAVDARDANRALPVPHILRVRNAAQMVEIDTRSVVASVVNLGAARNVASSL